jgi:hypothetical protein
MVICVGLTSSVLAEGKMNQPKMVLADQNFYMTEIKAAKGLTAQVRWNGIAIFSTEGDGGKTLSRMLQYWTFPGNNDLEIEVVSLDKAASENTGSILEISFRTAETIDKLDTEKDAIALKFKASQLKGKLKIPVTSSLKYNKLSLLDRADVVVEMGENDRQEIQKTVELYVASLKSNDIKTLMGLMSAVAADQNRLDQGDSVEYLKDMERGFRGSDSDYKNFDGDMSAMKLLAVAGGRAWTPINAKGKDFVSISVDGMSTANPLYFSKIDGHWVISRTNGGNAPFPRQIRK